MHCHYRMKYDIFLHPKINDILKTFQSKCIVQYFQPYLSVRFDTVQHVFSFSSVKEVEDVVFDLIQKGELVNVKIDGVNMTLNACHANEFEKKKKRELRKKLGCLGHTLVDDMENALMRLMCLEYGMIVNKGMTSNEGSGGAGNNTMKKRGKRREWSAVMMSDHDDDDDEDDDIEEDMEESIKYGKILVHHPEEDVDDENLNLHMMETDAEDASDRMIHHS